MQTGFELPLGNVPMGATRGRREDSGRLLTVEVGFNAQGKDYSVRLSTLASDPALFTQTNSAP